MGKTYILGSCDGFYIEKEDNVMDSLFKQYERVIIESLITSFGLDFIMNDRHDGDVDTIHNMRKIGEYENMTYKNKENQAAYETRGKYESKTYHSDKAYKDKNKEISMMKKEGKLMD